MDNDKSASSERRSLLLQNWMTVGGSIVAIGSFFSFVFLFLLDIFSRVSNPYLGILTYLVAPCFLVLGIGLLIAGILWHRLQVRRAGGRPAMLKIDLAHPRDRRMMIRAAIAVMVFL